MAMAAASEPVAQTPVSPAAMRKARRCRVARTAFSARITSGRAFATATSAASTS